MNVNSDSLMTIFTSCFWNKKCCVNRSALLLLVVYSQHVCDDTNTPHVCRKWHKVIVDNFWCQKLWGSKVDLQLFSGSIPGGRGTDTFGRFVFGPPIWRKKNRPKLIQQTLMIITPGWAGPFKLVDQIRNTTQVSGKADPSCLSQSRSLISDDPSCSPHKFNATVFVEV